MNPSMITKDKSAVELWTLEEVATLLKVPQKTIRQWIYLSRIPNIKLNGHVRFLKTDIESWIKESVR